LQYFSWFPEKLKTTHILPVLIPCVFIHLIVIKYNTNVDINAGRFGNLFLFYAGAFVGILFWVIIAMFLPYLSIISQIGKNTLVIFSLHMRVFSVLTAIAVFILEIPVNYLEDSMNRGSFLYCYYYWYSASCRKVDKLLPAVDFRQKPAL